MHDGVARFTNRQKAAAFKSCNKKASNTHISNRDRWVKKAVNKALCSPTVEEEMSQNLTGNELEAALKKLNANKAGGSDHIHPRLLKNLGRTAKDYILRLFNHV